MLTKNKNVRKSLVSLLSYCYVTEDLQKSLDILFVHHNKCKLTISIDRSKIMMFSKGERISNDLSFTYGDMEMEVVSKYTYLGIAFTVII